MCRRGSLRLAVRSAGADADGEEGDGRGHQHADAADEGAGVQRVREARSVGGQGLTRRLAGVQVEEGARLDLRRR